MSVGLLHQVRHGALRVVLGNALARISHGVTVDAGETVENGDGSAERAPENAGYLDSTGRHMQNFFDCMRSRKEPNCPFEMGFRTAIACQMAIASYRQQRTVRWDPLTEEIM